MPVSRVNLRDGARRRSSLAAGIPYFKPGRNASPELSSPNVTFAPNVTPITYNIEDDLFDGILPPVSPSTLFPPSQSPPPETKRTSGKRRSLGHIPRPPNAFMLFRADFVRKKHIPGSIETSHISLSKIIGNVWRELPYEDKQYWVLEAKRAKAEHKLQYPNYKFRPIHNKDKKKARDAKKPPVPTPVSEDIDRRAGAVAQMMLGGKKGEELASAVRAWEARNTNAPDMSFGHADPAGIPLFNPMPLYAGHRRSSSVPLPPYTQIAVPSIPFLVNSVQPVASQSWAFSDAVWDQPQQLQSYSLHQVPSPLPEPDHSLFQSEYLTQGSNVLSGQAAQKDFSNYALNHSHHAEVSPLDGIPPISTDFSQSAMSYSASTAGELYSATTYSTAPSPVSAYPCGDYSQDSYVSAGVDPLDQAPWPPSGSSSTFSGSPALTDHSLADGVVAPQPLHPSQHVQLEMQEWSQMEAAQAQEAIDQQTAQSFEEIVSSLEADPQVHAADGYDMFAAQGYADVAAPGDAFPAYDDMGMGINMDMAGF
ncbi:hypothetical protein EVJ58_g1285 [Rhodofomes roseus]|uniref:HMG box domain-containing protein n=1 Tax=Rhodofomes roseus TaxID=34475 RepID=A0A4Y9Z2A8_9APHY|nr:hypothetical protein EVJ58_g1285 [Rhodofomes roseus]